MFVENQNINLKFDMWNIASQTYIGMFIADGSKKNEKYWTSKMSSSTQSCEQTFPSHFLEMAFANVL